MNTKGVIGRTIVCVKQTRRMAHGAPYFDLDYIELDNGLRIYANVVETDDEYGVETGVVRKKAEK